MKIKFNAMRNIKNGFISLTLVIVISSLLFTLIATQSIEIAQFFDQTITKEYRIMNYYNANNCINLAILNISHDYFYEVISPVNIIDLTCSIDSVIRNNNLISIKATGNYKKINFSRIANVKLYDNKVELLNINP